MVELIKNINLDDLEQVKQALIKLYQDMANHTQPECAKCPHGTGKLAYSCCGPEYCKLAKQHAKDLWGVQLEETELYKSGRTNLPMLGESETGIKCTVAPHLRLACTIHTCDICSLGFKPNDSDWTAKYWKLRTTIEMLEYHKYKLSGKTFNREEYEG